MAQTPFQTAVDDNISVGVAGAEARVVEGFRDVNTETANAELAFGAVVSYHASGNVVAGGTNAIGVALASQVVTLGFTDAYPANAEANVMSQGYIRATAPSGASTTPASPVRYNTSDGTLTNAAVGAGVVVLEGARYVTSADAGELVVLRVNS